MAAILRNNYKLKSLLLKVESVTQTFIVGLTSRKWIFTHCSSLCKSFARMTAYFFSFSQVRTRREPLKQLQACIAIVLPR